MRAFIPDWSLGWSSWTIFGNAAFILPLLALAMGLLVLNGYGRAGWAWGVAVILASMAVAVSKIAFFGWGWGIRAWNLTCISGHTVMAMLCWPALLALLMPLDWRRMRRLALVAGIGVAVLVGWSRVATGAHAEAEVLTGYLLGGGALFLMWPHLHGARLACPVVHLIPLVLALGLVLGGLPRLPDGHLPSEQWWQQVAMQVTGRSTVFMRAAWLRGNLH